NQPPNDIIHSNKRFKTLARDQLMSQAYLSELFSLEDRVAIVTGGTGVLGGAMARGLARAGAKVAVLGRRQAQAETVAAEICNAGGEAIAVPADVLVREQLEA